MLVGLALAVSLGYLIAKTPLLEDVLSPVIVAFNRLRGSLCPLL